MTSTAAGAPVATPGLRNGIRRWHRNDVHFFDADDGVGLTLLRVRGEQEPTKGPVVLVHGSGVRAEIFRPPVRTTIVDTLVADGFDVWLLNWRGSIDIGPLPWTLDDAAAYDHPAAIRYILRQTGAPTVKAVVHCQGSTSFCMSAVAGLLPDVDVIVTNAVSLHPVLPAFSRVKIRTFRPAMQRVTPYLNPAWGDGPDTLFSWMARGVVMATHWECSNPVCRMVSFTYGSGRPALWRHENLNRDTHEWVRGEFGEVPMSFFAQMDASVAAGQLVSVSSRPGLLERYADEAPHTDARFALLVPELNRCFLPESQERTFEHLRRHRPGKDSIHRIPGYGHLDPFISKHAVRDVFPTVLDELNK
ncbi:alpha/beta fold hydrolase [Demequina sp.]|uniref:alpha/beta fold hydrolase n=1 Tax=Demequina sp. TaxID=2050685 RepID=UPI0025E42EAA|nr:alpha/beta fold hydrolase [Demequina sp.]